MKLIHPKVELLKQEYEITDVYKQIEKCGRTCYKSEDLITTDSARKFVERIIKSNHLSMLEHGTIYLKVENADDLFIDNYIFNPYSQIILDEGTAYITTNMRVIYELEWEDHLKYMCKPERYHRLRYTFKITTDLGIARELCRHRIFSFAQESTRYCNYSKDKFGNELTFIIPSWINEELIDTKQSKDERGAWLAHSFRDAEISYFSMLNKGATPEQARQVLPLALKTDICITGYEMDFYSFFKLRLSEKTGKVHPDMKVIAKKMFDILDDTERIN